PASASSSSIIGSSSWACRRGATWERQYVRPACSRAAEQASVAVSRASRVAVMGAHCGKRRDCNKQQGPCEAIARALTTDRRADQLSADSTRAVISSTLPTPSTREHLGSPLAADSFW